MAGPCIAVIAAGHATTHGNGRAAARPANGGFAVIGAALEAGGG